MTNPEQDKNFIDQLLGAEKKHFSILEYHLSLSEITNKSGRV